MKIPNLRCDAQNWWEQQECRKCSLSWSWWPSQDSPTSSGAADGQQDDRKATLGRLRRQLEAALKHFRGTDCNEAKTGLQKPLEDVRASLREDQPLVARMAGIQACLDRKQKGLEKQDTRIGKLQLQLDEAVEERNECVTQMDALRVELRDSSTRLAEQAEADDADLTGGTTFVDNTKEVGCSQPTSANGRTASLATPDLVQQLAAQLVPMVSQAAIATLTAQSMTVPTANLLTLENKCPPTPIAAQQRDPPPKWTASPRGRSPRPRSLATPSAPQKHRALKYVAEEGDWTKLRCRSSTAVCTVCMCIGTPTDGGDA